ncbi:hypothetical protein E5C31_08250 [Providencia rettgeri]|nr:hypothetical protein [Providencia rettgeri]
MMIRRITAVLAAFLMLAACSPEFNWRKVQLEQTGLSAMLPGKPTTSHRLLDFEHYKLDFYLTTSTAGGQSYTVGHVILPKELQQDEAARQRLYEALHESLREKFIPDGQVSEKSQIQLPPPGQIFYMTRDVGGVALRLEAMIRIEPGWLVQGFVMTDSGKAPDAAQAKVFFDGLAR